MKTRRILYFGLPIFLLALLSAAPARAQGPNAERRELQQRLQKMEEALQKTQDPEQRERIAREIQSLRAHQARGRGPQPASIEHGVLFLPPDFYHQHREELGIGEDQLRKMQTVAEQVFKPANELQEEMKKRTQALHEVLAKHPTNPDEAAERLRQVLEVENQMKVMQLHAKLSIRNTLSAEQFEKLKQLVAKSLAAQKGPGDHQGANATARIKQKFEALKQQIQRRIGENPPPPKLVEKLEHIQRTARDGRLQEAEEQIDILLRDVSRDAPKNDE